ncbi:hypothetical protein BJX76DRAFT_326899 [Aspergillus varians]
MANSTHPHHVHTPVSDTLDADEKIILVLGAVVFLTFALGLVSRLYDTPFSFPRGKQYWEEEEFSGFHNDPEVGDGAGDGAGADVYTAKLNLPIPSATRYGGIKPYLVNSNGVQKMVLVVPPGDGDQVQDAHSLWFARWRQRLETDPRQQFLDERSPLLGGWS